MSRPKVTIYIPCHNYGHYLRQAVDSVLKQNVEDWELLLIDDGSSDDSASICAEYSAEHSGKISYHRFDTPQGLRRAANWAIETARGEYLMRLDADDYLDESAILVLSNWLDNHPESALVYPNWIYVSEEGDILGVENRKRVNDEVEVLDLPAHGACTMIRRRVLKEIGGYDPNFDAQDGHELWMKIVRRYRVGNVSTPLFFYRQHAASMSVDGHRLLDSRRHIKRELAEREQGAIKPRVVAVIPARRDTFYFKGLPLTPVGNRPLISHTLDQAMQFGFDAICVSTDDEGIYEFAKSFADVIPVMRDVAMRGPRIGLSQVLASTTETLEQENDIYPDIVVMLGITAPLRRNEYITEALDTLKLYEVDSVISVLENTDVHFVHDRNGLRPLSRSSVSQLRFERDALLVGNGAIYATWRDLLDSESLFSGRVGHVVMPREDSVQVRHPEDITLINHLIQARQSDSK